MVLFMAEGAGALSDDATEVNQLFIQQIYRYNRKSIVAAPRTNAKGSTELPRLPRQSVYVA